MVESLTNTQKELIPQIVEKAVKLTTEQQMWLLGWMQAKNDENEDKGNVRRRKSNNK